jgi:ABC-2 type transport system ATP-binding protein
LILVEDKAVLMRKLGKKQLTCTCRSRSPPCRRPSTYALGPGSDGAELVYSFDAQAESTGIAELMKRLTERGHRLQGPAHRGELASRTSS